jgi:hypothetical protein
MNVAKLSISTRMAINDNFGFPKGEDGTIGAFVKVSKNIDKELKDLGASIQGFMQGQTTGELFTIRFPISSLGKISEIDGLVYLDIGEKVTQNDPIYYAKVATPQAPESAIQYYTNPKVLKTLAFSALPIGFVAYYCYHKKFSLLKSAIYVSIPIVAIEILSRLGAGASHNSYWANYLPPSLKKSIEKKPLEPK